MTDAATATPAPQPAEYVKIWAENFAQVLGQISAGSVAAGSMATESIACVARSQAPAGLAPAAEDDLWAIVTSTGGLRGEMRLRAAAATVLHLAQIFMSEAVSAEAPLTGDHREALIELLRQVAGLVATSVRARWGEIQLRVELAPAPPSWPPAETFWLLAGEEGPAGMTLELGLSAALVAELRAEKSESSRTESSSPAAPPPAASDAPAGAIDLLMDVQLAVTMRFGSRRLLLREVLDLGPGAVVELDRRVQEPVDLLLDGRLVARGEVVVIDGNYGLRVTDASPVAVPHGSP